MDNERSIYDDLPGRFYHSAVMTSYSFNLPYFDKQLLRRLQAKGIRSINLLVDQKQLNESTDFDIDIVENVGKEYSISGIPSSGAFHPKLNFFFGEKHIALTFGSCNLSIGGNGKNHEVFSGLMADDSDKAQLPLIREAWDYITMYLSHTMGYSKTRLEKDVPSSCSLMKEPINYKKHTFQAISDKYDMALLYNENNSSIFKQLKALLPKKDISEIIIVSPFFDADGSSLTTLLDLCPNAKMKIYLQTNCILPPTRIKANPKIDFYDFSDTNRGKDKEKNAMPLHAKIFIFKADDCSYCMIGSANATKAALGNEKESPINDEFCGLFYSSKNGFFHKQLGLDGKATKIDVKTLTRNTSTSDPANKTNCKIRIAAIDYFSSKLTLYLDGKSTLKNVSLLGYFNNSGCIEICKIDVSKEVIEIPFDMEDLTFCAIADQEGNIISNKQYVNYLHDLELTHPSRINQEITQLLSNISSGNYSSIEIIQYISDIYQQLYNNSEKIAFDRKYGYTRIRKKKEDLPELNNFESDRLDDEQINGIIHKANSITRILECINKAIRTSIQQITDEQMGEEDVADPSNSSKRIQERERITINKTKLESLKQELEAMLNNYNKFLRSRACKKSNGISKTDGEFFWIATQMMLEIAYFNLSLYDFDKGIRDSRKIMDNIIIQWALKTVNNFMVMSIKCHNETIENADINYLNLLPNIRYQIILTAFLFYRTVVHSKTHEQKIILCIVNMRNIFGDSDSNEMNDYFQQLSNNYSINFDTASISRFYQNMIDEYELNKKGYQEQANFGIVKIVKKGSQSKFLEWE